MIVKYNEDLVTGVANYTFFASYVRCFDMKDAAVYSCVETSADLFEDLISGSMYPFEFEQETTSFCPNAYEAEYVPVVYGLSQTDVAVQDSENDG